MAKPLSKLEYIVRDTSTVTRQGAYDAVKAQLEDRQAKDTANVWFADILDARDGYLSRIYSDAAKKEYQLSRNGFDIVKAASGIVVCIKAQ